MKRTILRAKVIAYILLVVMTTVFGCLSFDFYRNDVETRTLPQITRAMIQISQLIPQLEENEQAVRDVYNNLEMARQAVLRNNSDNLGQQEQHAENAEGIIDKTLSWMNRVTMLKVGHRGHVIVVSKDDNTILAHSDRDFVGEKLYAIGDIDVSSIPDVSSIDAEHMPSDFHLFFPISFFQENVSIDRFLAAADAGIYGTVVSYNDTYILCGITVYEAIVNVLARCIVTTLIFFLASWVIVRYIGFSLEWHQDDRRSFFGKIIFFSAVSVVFLFVSASFYQALMEVSSDLATMDAHAQVAVENLNTYQEYREQLSAWLDDQ